MKAIVQHLGSGETSLIKAPVPVLQNAKPGALIRNSHSLVSIGTERMLVEFGRGSWLSKARQQPDKVKQVLEKASTDGVLATVDSVQSKLNQPIPMGYCAAGVVVESNCAELKAGDRVVSNGNHAEFVYASRNLVAKVPDAVSLDQAAFTPVVAIGLQGVRLVRPELGETVVVMGLGLIGLVTVQLLLAQGCKVIGTDYDASRVALAQSFGATGIVLGDASRVIEQILSAAEGRGVDAVLITASTKSDDPVHQAAQVCRKRGRIVLVGVVGLKLRRDDFYEKELSFQVSCSYGPGRYDPFHEEAGHDYPVGFVRWTEKRNFEAVLELMASGRVAVDSLISSRYDFGQAVDAYQEVANSKTALGIMLDYPDTSSTIESAAAVVDLEPEHQRAQAPGDVVCSFIGSGNYASRVLMPAFKKSGATFGTVVSQGGISGAHHGRVQGFASAASSSDAVFNDNSTNVVVIATRHDSHASLVLQALAAGKQVFVEKPLALTVNEVDEIEAAVRASALPNPLMVGFNRRYAPLVAVMKDQLASVSGPKCFNFTMNAGKIPADSWVQSQTIGGGRIVGEACHLIDLMRYLAGAPITAVQAMGMGPNPAHDVVEDKAVINLSFADGSVGALQYFANGGTAFPKERIEVFAGDAVLQLDNFRMLRGFGWRGFRTRRLLRQDKGQGDCVAAYLQSVTAGKGSPIPAEQLIEVSRATIDAASQIRQSCYVD